jgi:hypothetical protein
MVNNLSLFSLLFAILLFAQPAAAVNVDFDEFTTTGVSVDTLSVDGVDFTSDDAWITNQVDNSKYTILYDRCISAFPDGAASLTMDFDIQQTNLNFGIGSGIIGQSITVSVTGYLDSSQVFFQSFSTSPASCSSPPCADEVLVQIPGPVDRVVVVRTAGETGPNLDNLQGIDRRASIPTINEWGMIILAMFVTFASVYSLRRKQSRTDG